MTTSIASRESTQSITTSVARRITSGREREFVQWTEAGIALVRTFPGFLGGGWVRSAADSEEYHVLYRFADHASLDAWTRSPARRAWVDRGLGVAQDTMTHRLTGVEGWFEPQSAQTSTVRVPAPPPPRWKQAVAIWLGFFPLSLVMNWLLAPHLADVDIVSRTVLLTLINTPIMVYVLLPFVTVRLRRWLQR